METNASGSYILVSEEKTNSLYPMCLGVSCAFVALRLLTEPDKEDEKLCEFRNKMLLLGLLVWRIQREGADEEKRELLQKLENTKKEIEELKKRRQEDAKANEKVVGIFASQEQNWFNERKKLRLQIGALMNEMRAMEKKKNESISDWEEKLKEMEALAQSKDKVLEEEEEKRKELEEKLAKAENEAQELRETLKKKAQEHSAELGKQKTAFIELVSNQRQLEAELDRSLKQNEARRYELDLFLDQREESAMLAQKLSSEIVRMGKELEQKDQILSVMLRKSKLDSAEKQMLLKEVKVSKAKRKQAELEIEKWRAASETGRHERHSLRSMFAIEAKSRGASNTSKSRSETIGPIIQYEHWGLNRDPGVVPDIIGSYSQGEGREQGPGACNRKLEGWVCSEAEGYEIITGKRHHMELDAFAEQIRLKDEKLEALYRHLMSTELESKRLQSYIEGLNQEMSQLRHDKVKLEAMLGQQQEESDALKKQFSSQLKCLTFHKSSKLRIIKGEPLEEQETETHSKEATKELDAEKEVETSSHCESKNVSLIDQSPEKGREEEIRAKNGCFKPESVSTVENKSIEKLPYSSQSLVKVKNSHPWRTDLHALGVSYKIKRLKQQLVMLERFTGKQESQEIMESSDRGKKACVMFMTLLNKQVNRYQSLQEKTDDLCKRMHENDPDKSHGDIRAAKAKGDAKAALEHFLEETFQLQRYIVATGQKLMEIQSKIASGFVNVLDKLDDKSSSSSSSFDTKGFAESIRTLFQEVQRGLEVRIARIIGDLEGTLACEGMIDLRRR